MAASTSLWLRGTICAAGLLFAAILGAQEPGREDRGADSSRLAALVDAQHLAAASPVGPDQLPALAQAFLVPRDDGAHTVVLEHRRVLAYEIELASHHGYETEIFVDRHGRSLLTVVKPDADGDTDVAETVDDLPKQVRETIEGFLGGTPLARLQREIEWGVPVHAVKWIGPRGVQEMKILDDGGVLFIELPAGEPVPAAVRRLARGVEVEAMLLDVFVAVSEAEPGLSRAVLSVGWPIPFVPVGGEPALARQSP